MEKLGSLINKIKKNSVLYEKQSIKDDICCLCLEKLNNKICYECKNCHKGFCLKNEDCDGIIEHLKYRETCPNCIQSFIKSEEKNELLMRPCWYYNSLYDYNSYYSHYESDSDYENDDYEYNDRELSNIVEHSLFYNINPFLELTFPNLNFIYDECDIINEFSRNPI